MPQPRVDHHDPDGPPLLAAIEFEPPPALTDEERELGVFLAPFAVDKGRILYSLEEIFVIFQDFLPPRDELFAQLLTDRVLVDVGRDIHVPPLAHIVAGLLRYLHPEEAGDNLDFEVRQPYFTLKGVLWFLERYANVPEPHRRMEVPSELIYAYLHDPEIDLEGV